MSGPDEPLDAAAERARRRADAGRANPEPSLASRLGQIGVLGWAIVTPVLIALVLGRWLDRHFSSGVFFTAPAIMIGAGFGLWTAWRWMHRS